MYSASTSRDMLRRKANKSSGAVVGGRVGRVEKRREERRVFMRDDDMLVPARLIVGLWVTAQPRCPLGCGIGSEPRVCTLPSQSACAYCSYYSQSLSPQRSRRGNKGPTYDKLPTRAGHPFDVSDGQGQLMTKQLIWRGIRSRRCPRRRRHYCCCRQTLVSVRSDGGG
jgi:hypothetical protein